MNPVSLTVLSSKFFVQAHVFMYKITLSRNLVEGIVVFKLFINSYQFYKFQMITLLKNQEGTFFLDGSRNSRRRACK